LFDAVWFMRHKVRQITIISSSPVIQQRNDRKTQQFQLSKNK